jgi:F-type H+-transporting ATPase subunit gamma
MILPLSSLKGADEPAAKPGLHVTAQYLFHPDPRTILLQVLPLVVKMTVFNAMLENTAAEHAARRVAMKNATDNADDMIRSLTQQYNRARQGKITREIAEIVGGSNAL